MQPLVPLQFSKIMQTRSYSVIVLASETKKFAIYTEPSTGKLLQLHLTDSEKARPMTHDLIQLLLKGLGGKLLRVVISGLQDNVYFAKLYLTQQVGSEQRLIEVDARPSDAITLAILSHAPLLCHPSVLEKTLAVED